MIECETELSQMTDVRLCKHLIRVSWYYPTKLMESERPEAASCRVHTAPREHVKVASVRAPFILEEKVPQVSQWQQKVTQASVDEILPEDQRLEGCLLSSLAPPPLSLSLAISHAQKQACFAPWPSVLSENPHPPSLPKLVSVSIANTHLCPTQTASTGKMMFCIDTIKMGCAILTVFTHSETAHEPIRVNLLLLPC